MEFCKSCKNCSNLHNKCNLSDVNYKKVKGNSVLKLDENEIFESCKGCNYRGIECELLPKKKRFQERAKPRIRLYSTKSNSSIKKSKIHSRTYSKKPLKRIHPNNIYSTHKQVFIADISTREVLNFLMDFDWKN